MLVSHSFDQRFVNLIERLRTQYGEEMLELTGIGAKDLDINRYSKHFFSDHISTTADATIDANANVSDKSVNSWQSELRKPIMKLNAYYQIWKDAEKKHGIKRANKMIEADVNGAIRVHDCHFWNLPYSYYRETPICIRINGGHPHVITMKQLFDMYKEYAYTDGVFDKEEIDLQDVGKTISYGDVIPIMHGKKFVGKYWKRGKTINSPIIEKHNIEILDGDGKWTKLQKVLRHKRDTKMVAYQTENGDYSVVTDNHPVILEDGSTIDAGKLEPGMKIKQSSVSIFNNLAIEYIDVPMDLAYLIGFISGDGNVDRHAFYSDNNNLLNTDLAINITKWEGGISIYQKNIKNHFIFNVLKRLFPDTDEFTRKSLKRSEHSISFSNGTLRMLLNKYFNIDYGMSSYTKNVPTNILSWNKEAKAAYIAGLIDSEGTIHTNGAAEIRMKAHGIMNLLSEICASIGVKTVKRFTGKKFENFYGIIIYWNDAIKTYSEKLEDIELNVKLQYDTNRRSNIINKVTIFDPDNDIKNAYNLKNEDKEFYYVYDITTESHTFYAGGMTQHNCFAFSLTKLVNEGMPFYDRIKIGPVKHFDSFINLSLQFLCYASNNLAGAVAFPDFLVYAEYFIRKDYGENWYEDESIRTKINQLFQNWIFSVNFSWRSNQSAFTNISVFDNQWIDALFSGHMNPDYSPCDKVNLKRVQRMFVNELVRCRKDNPFTFPVMTACFLIDKETKEFKDQAFLDYISEVNAKTGIFNIYTSDTADSLSSCCVKGNSVIRVINKATNVEELLTLETFVNRFVENDLTVDKTFETPDYAIKSYNYKTNEWETEDINGILKKPSEHSHFIKIDLGDNHIIEVTPDHTLTVRVISTGEIKEVKALNVFNAPSEYEIGVID